MILTFPHLFHPREYQRPILKALFEDGIKHFYLLQHRRSGKDRIAFICMIGQALKRKGLYLYIFPAQNQIRKAIWRGIGADGVKFLDQIPEVLIARINSTDMSIELINGSIIQFVGGSNVDSLVGTNPVMILYSEFALFHPGVRPYLTPILAENDGVEMILTTPRGKNHAYDLYQHVRHDERWYTSNLTVLDTKRHDGTPVISQTQIEEERRGGMPEEMIQSEFYNNWNVGQVGAYYTEELDIADRENRIGILRVTRQPVYTFWDLGISDSTAIWWMQPNGEHLDLIYSYENTGKGIEHYIDVIHKVQQQLQINYRTHYAPHDIQQRDWVSARSRIEMARDKGIIFQVVPKVGIEDGIQAVKSLFPQLRFHVEHCKGGLQALREYKREYDEITRSFKPKPLHDWSSNYADAARYMAVMWRDLFRRPESNQVRSYNLSEFETQYHQEDNPDPTGKQKVPSRGM